MLPDNSSDTATSRIRPDDTFIGLPIVRVKMGGMSVSAVYDDPELMKLRIVISRKMVRWIEREIDEERARRVANSEARAANVRAQIEQRRERRRAKQRATPRKASPAAAAGA